MKVSTAAIVLSMAAGAEAWSQPSRSSLRSLGQKTVAIKSESRVNGNTMKMEGQYRVVRSAFREANMRRKA